MTDEAPADPHRRRRRVRRLAAITAILGLSALCAVAASATILGRPQQEKRLLATLAKALPGAAISAVDCKGGLPQGLCEILVRRNVFYATPDGRFVIVGQVLDLTRKVDLTERRRAEVRGLAHATDQITGALPEPAAEARPPPAPRPAAPQVLKVDLPASNAVVHNPGAALKVTAFIDFNCHYCRQLFQGFEGVKDIEVTEYPIAILGEDSARKARGVLCARDRSTAAAAAYRGAAPTSSDCPDGARRLQENLAFAQAHGISGTPMIVRADGATHPGWMPKDQLLAWLRQAPSLPRAGR